jgi:hypothetical protein
MPPILPVIGDTWPTGGSASAYAVFTDTTGAVLATVDGEITASKVLFQGIPHTTVDPVPAGANCEIFVTDSSGNPYKIRYGRVARRQVNFPNAFSSQPSMSALAFNDTFQRSALGTYWTPVNGTTVIYDNTTLGTVQFDSDGVGGATDIGTPSALDWLHYPTAAIDKIILAWVAAVPVSPSSYAALERTCTFTPTGLTTPAPMASAGAIDSGGGTVGWLELFWLMNPPTIGGTLAYDVNADMAVIIGNSEVYNGTSGITPGSFVSSQSAAAEMLTETVTSAAGKYVAAAFAAGQAFLTMTSTGNTGSVRDIANIFTGSGSNAGNLAIADAPGTASMAISASTAATGPMAGIAVSLDPAPPLAYGVSAQNNLFGNAVSAMRYFTALNTDNVSVNVNMLNNGAGSTIVVLCSDITMTSWLGVEFTEPNNQINFVIGTSPTTWQSEGSTISNAVSNNDNYTISYNNNTKTLAVYKNNSLTPLGTWVDTGGLVPHGPGFRYTGFVFNNPADSNGLQVSGWAAQDQV